MRQVSGLLLTILIVITLLITGCSPKETATTAPVTPTVPTPTVTLLPRTTETETTPPPTSLKPAETPTTSPPAVNSFHASSPAVKFTDKDIAFLGVDFTSNPDRIADTILKWQEDNWTYVFSPADYTEVSDPIRWNYFLPGLYTSRDIIHDQVKDGRIYGICFSYAITYASIAELYGLETRVVNSISKPSQSNPDVGFTTGMSPEEYARLKVRLDAAGLDYAYEAVRLVAEETPSHYWAEVKLDGKWVVMDATQKATGNNTQTGFIDKNDFEITDWLSRDKSGLLEEYQARLNNGETLPNTENPVNNLPTIKAAPDYVGMTDDLGQKNRAANIDDVMKALAPVPYFNYPGDAFNFINGTGISQGKIDVIQQVKTAYEQQSGKKFYVVAFLMNQQGQSGDELAASYYYLCGEELDMEAYQQATEYLPQ